MPITRNTDRVRIALLLSAHSSPALAFLLRETFERANRVVGGTRYTVRFVAATRAAALSLHGAAVPVAAPRGGCEFLIVPPLVGIDAHYAPAPDEVALVRRLHRRGTVVASACLGALTLAAAGLLDAREATTHWAWKTLVAERHPRVRWALSRMLVDGGDVITAGGYLAAVDLALHIVARTSSRDAAHRLGQALLADSTRQKQSIYAQALIDPKDEPGRFGELTRWIERHLERPLDAHEMARRCRMSRRSFHRHFVALYGVTPRKFVQIKRIERAQELLRTTRRSVEQVVQSVGVSDVASFRRVFQRELGCSPAMYRRTLRL